MPTISTRRGGVDGSDSDVGRRAPRLAETHVGVPRQIISKDDDISVRDLHEQGLELQRRERFLEAAAIHRRVTELDPDSEWGVRSLLELAHAEESLRDHAAAARTFERLAQRYPDNVAARDALIRAVRLRVFLEEWSVGAALAEAFLARYRDASPLEQVVVLSARALDAIDRGNDDEAARHVESGRRIIEANGFDQAGAVPRDLAQLYYALGEIRRVRAERIRFDPVPANFGVELERRCQLLLDAQGAYSDAMRAYDAHWSSMAGFRVAELYAGLHSDIMSIPTPEKSRRADRQRLFEGAMRLRYSVLLTKGISMLDHTLEMAERTQETSEWVERAKRLKAELAQATLDEQAAIDRLGYSREQLQAALDALIKNAR